MRCTNSVGVRATLVSDVCLQVYENWFGGAFRQNIEHFNQLYPSAHFPCLLAASGSAMIVFCSLSVRLHSRRIYFLSILLMDEIANTVSDELESARIDAISGR